MKKLIIMYAALFPILTLAAPINMPVDADVWAEDPAIVIEYIACDVLPDNVRILTQQADMELSPLVGVKQAQEAVAALRAIDRACGRVF